MVKIYKQPFAHDGDTIVIPDASQPDGKISNADGWTVDYQLPSDDPNYKPVDRHEMNGVFKEVTEALGEIQQFGFAKWQPMQWPQGARVVEGGVVYRALNQTSQQPPHADWEDDSAVRLTDNQTIAGVKTFSSFPVTPSDAPTDDYQAANKKYVDDSAIGMGQTWQDMTASRAVATTYTNTTGKPIYLFVIVTDTYGVGYGFSVSGVDVNVPLDFPPNGYYPLSLIIPAGETYSLSSTMAFSHWLELR